MYKYNQPLIYLKGLQPIFIYVGGLIVARFNVYDGSKYVSASVDTLTFTGAVTGSYDGSEPLTVEIPSSPVISGGNIETVESQLVDMPSKLSQLTNDAGYLTLDTLPKYDGSVT